MRIRFGDWELSIVFYWTRSLFVPSHDGYHYGLVLPFGVISLINEGLIEREIQEFDEAEARWLDSQ